MTSIELYAFWSCTSLTNVTIGDGLTEISKFTFINCSALTSVIIGNNVTAIGYGAFEKCALLEAVYYNGTASEWDAISIDNNNDYLNSATVYYYSETEPTESGNYWHYNASGEVEIWS